MNIERTNEETNRDKESNRDEEANTMKKQIWRNKEIKMKNR